MTDLTQMLLNLSRSLGPVQELLTGFGYFLGIGFVFLSIFQFQKIGNSTARSSSQEKMFVPILYLVMGVALIYLPTSIDILTNTAFGSGNVLEYSSSTQDPLIDAIIFLIKTTGVIWFVRGTVLLTQASEPGVQEGPKGLTFLIAGVFAINIENTTLVVDQSLTMLLDYISGVKSNIG